MLEESCYSCSEITNRGILAHCHRCHHTWWKRSDRRPKACPSCKQRQWDQKPRPVGRPPKTQEPDQELSVKTKPIGGTFRFVVGNLISEELPADATEEQRVQVLNKLLERKREGEEI